MIRPLQLLAASAASLAIGLAGATVALAADRGEATPLDLEPVARPVESAASGGGMVRAFLALLVVVALIYGVYWVARRARSAGAAAVADRGALAAVAGVSLGAGRSVHLVRAGRELLLVGSSQSGVVALRVYDEEQAQAAGLSLDDGRPDDMRGARPPAGALLREAVERLRRLTERG